MNFYQAQDQARKQSRLLVALFVLAVVVLLFVTNICVALFILYSDPSYSFSGQADPSFSAKTLQDWLGRLASALGWKKALWTSLLVCGAIFMAMGFKWMSLRQGGRVVAEALGGSLVQPSTKLAEEKRLLNVVEEIALASGTPVPQVYVLKNELGINAFAAGLSAEDAVIGITQGALLAFNREQLQGVIAHEFSHILNGDMRLNMKLVAVLHGILMIAEAGYFFMRMNSSRRYVGRRRDNRLTGLFFVLGLSLWLIGLLGQLFGALIKAGVSRQREFLADASAVQFTRNPDGIAQALSIIGGASRQSKLEHHGAHELSHMFFSNANVTEFGSKLFHPSRWAWFATHPPLPDRIKRIQPRWAGRYIKPERPLEEALNYQQSDPRYPAFAEMQSNLVSQTVVSSASQGITANHLSEESTYRFIEFEPVSVPAADSTAGTNEAVSLQESNLSPVNAFDELRTLAHESYDASLMIIAMLLSSHADIKAKQYGLIEQAYPKNGQNRVKSVESLCSKVRALNAKQLIDIVELALPSLKQMSLKQYHTEKKLLVQLIKCDRKVGVFDWLIFQLVTQYLDRHFGLSRPLKPKYKNLNAVGPMFEVVLSRVVHYGFEDKSPAQIDEQDKRLAFVRACDVAGVHGLSLLSIEKCAGKLFSQAVSRLSLAYPLLKPRLIKGLLEAIHFDEEITDNERYVITAIALVMDCPLVGLDMEE